MHSGKSVSLVWTSNNEHAQYEHTNLWKRHFIPALKVSTCVSGVTWESVFQHVFCVFVAEHWTVMDLREVQGLQQTRQAPAGCFLLGTEGPPAPGPLPELWIKEGQPYCTEQWTGSCDSLPESVCECRLCVCGYHQYQQLRLFSYNLMVHRYMMWVLL